MIIAIDPGLGGGIAIFNDPEINLIPMPRTLGDLATVLKVGMLEGDAIVYLELPPKFTGSKLPGSTIGTMFRNVGQVEGLVTGYGYRLILVAPQKWQKRLSLGTRAGAGGTGQWKNKLKAEAQRRFPKVQGLTLKTADALLILDYAIEDMRRGTPA